MAFAGDSLSIPRQLRSGAWRRAGTFFPFPKEWLRPWRTTCRTAPAGRRKMRPPWPRTAGSQGACEGRARVEACIVRPCAARPMEQERTARPGDSVAPVLLRRATCPGNAKSVVIFLDVTPVLANKNWVGTFRRGYWTRDCPAAVEQGHPTGGTVARHQTFPPSRGMVVSSKPSSNSRGLS